MDLEARILAVRLRYGQVRIGTGISDPIAGIWAFELEYRPQGWGFGASRLGLGVLGARDLGLPAGVWALMLELGPRG